MAIFGQKPCVNSFGKMQFFDVLNFLFLYCLKKKVGKMAIFAPKLWVNPFGKMSIFQLFKFFFFYSLEMHFFRSTIS